MRIKKCPECGAPIKPNARHCEYCGSTVEPDKYTVIDLPHGKREYQVEAFIKPECIASPDRDQVYVKVQLAQRLLVAILENMEIHTSYDVEKLQYRAVARVRVCSIEE